MLGWVYERLASIARVRVGLRRLGDRGESVAARYLKRRGYRILMRNYVAAGGEIDLVALQGEQLVFVEVKTRRSNEINEPYRQVNRHKQHNLTKAAKAYLGHYRGRPPRARFDVLSIVWPEQGEPQITHLINAFEPTF